MVTPEEHVVPGAGGDFSRKVWLLEPPHGHTATRLCLFLDGEYYVNQMAAASVIHGLQKDGAISPVTCIFVSHVDGAARHRDLTCSRDHAAFIASDVIRWIRDRQPKLAKGGHLIAGPSLGGLASAYTALLYPQVFARCLSHSGSFWWAEEWLTTQLRQMPHSRLHFWLSVGSQETGAGISHPPSGLRQEVSQIHACERFATALAGRDHHVHYRVYEGGHEMGQWREELPNALQWLLP